MARAPVDQVKIAWRLDFNVYLDHCGFGAASTMKTRSKRACCLIVHFGEKPGWYDLWKLTALRNRAFDFFLVTDMKGIETEENIHVVSCDVKAFNALPLIVAEELRLSRPYKICDFKPLFGELFSDVVEAYDYWGFGDLDVLLGDLEHVLANSFGKFDYIATGRDGESGPLAFLRNSSVVGSLWRQIPDVHAKLNDDAHYALDERNFLELLKREVQCDIEFRECLDDLPARWTGGKIVSLHSGKQYALHHFGGRLTNTRAGIVRDMNKLLSAMEQGRSIRIGTSGALFVEEPASVIVDNAKHLLRLAKSKLRALR